MKCPYNFSLILLIISINSRILKEGEKNIQSPLNAQFSIDFYFFASGPIETTDQKITKQNLNAEYPNELSNKIPIFAKKSYNIINPIKFNQINTENSPKMVNPQNILQCRTQSSYKNLEILNQDLNILKKWYNDLNTTFESNEENLNKQLIDGKQLQTQIENKDKKLYMKNAIANKINTPENYFVKISEKSPKKIISRPRITIDINESKFPELLNYLKINKMVNATQSYLINLLLQEITINSTKEEKASIPNLSNLECYKQDINLNQMTIGQMILFLNTMSWFSNNNSIEKRKERYLKTDLRLETNFFVNHSEKDFITQIEIENFVHNFVIENCQKSFFIKMDYRYEDEDDVEQYLGDDIQTPGNRFIFFNDFLNVMQSEAFFNQNRPFSKFVDEIYKNEFQEDKDFVFPVGQLKHRGRLVVDVDFGNGSDFENFETFLKAYFEGMFE